MVVCFQCRNHSYPGQQHLGISTFFLYINKISLGCGSVSSSKNLWFSAKMKGQVQNWLQFPAGIIHTPLCAGLEPVCSWMDFCPSHINGRVRRNILMNNAFYTASLYDASSCTTSIYLGSKWDTRQFLGFNARWHLDGRKTWLNDMQEMVLNDMQEW